MEWKKVEKAVRDESERLGFRGRFGPCLPRILDGSMLFLLHLVSKMRPVTEAVGHFAIVLNGSRLLGMGLFITLRKERKEAKHLVLWPRLAAARNGFWRVPIPETGFTPTKSANGKNRDN